MQTTTPLSSSTLGVCVLPPPPRNMTQTVTWAGYMKEILDHAGLCYRTVDWSELSDLLPALKILVTVGETSAGASEMQPLRDWIEAGGALISIGGVCGMADVLGVAQEKPSYTGWGVGFSNLGEGYLKPVKRKHPTLSHLEIPLHFFNGVPVTADGCDVLAGILDKHQGKTNRVGLSIKKCGKGTAMLVAVDLTGAVVRIQQGVAVTQDGVSAPDGSAPVTDNVLKSDDGLVLDWIFDRQPVPHVPGLNAFLQPIADQWKELLLRSIFHLATEHDVPLFALWLYPRNLPALAHMSHDTDGSENHKGWLLLDALKKAGIQSTWCTILPGYDSAVFKAVAEAGHELAMHYDSMTEGLEWSEEQFTRQYNELVAMFDGHKPITNKNHYLRWEGDMELYDWCLRKGIQMDQTKGASKTGEAGYNFGTCHPYFPMARNGEMVDVLELPTPTQDLHVFAPPAMAQPLLKASLKHHGVLHLLYHPAHIDKPGVAESLVEISHQAIREGVEWWTAEKLNHWERARRTVKWSETPFGGADTAATFTSGAALKGATLLVLQTATSKKSKPQIDDKNEKAEKTMRWGFPFKAITLDVEPGVAHILNSGAK